MKIKHKDLHEWIASKLVIRHRGELYRADYNGMYYMLRPLIGNDVIKLYKKGRGVYGLETNIKTN